MIRFTMLTFFLTDIEGSTPLWEQQPEAMRLAIHRHDALVEAVLAEYGGRQIKERGEGDSVFAVFTSPVAALLAACALQRAFLAESWPVEAPLKVRIGLHSGEAELRGGDYYGATVNRAARVRSLGHGGQILISQATRDLLGDALPAGVGLRALGAYALKGLQRPENIHQVLHADLPAEFPPLQSAPLARTNLPMALTSFVGRRQEQATVRTILSEARLVTLTGVGGCGKTRLALQVASSLLDNGDASSSFPDGIWLVELAALDGHGGGATPLVPLAVATALGLREEPGRPLKDTLIEALRARRVLLLLDNCEHLVDGCAALTADLLPACPHLRLLATSREALGVPGERIFLVPSLTVPDPQHATLEALREVESVALFLDRARAGHPSFDLTPQNAPAIARICTRLDGIPLAIELAAARVGTLTVEGIADRLEGLFRLLTGGPRTVLPRQQTLRAALDWSYDLLAVQERTLLRRLAVFAGGWSLDGAEAVCSGDGLEAWAVLDLVDSLNRKSLVVVEERDREPRYRLLEPVRQYAASRLVDDSFPTEAATVRSRHLRYYLKLAEDAAAAREQASGSAMRSQDWLARLEIEHDNLQAALSWSLAQEDTGESALRLAAALAWFWEIHDHLVAGQYWLGRALERGVSPTPERARALDGAGCLARCRNSYTEAEAYHQESLALWRALGNKSGMATALAGLGVLAAAQDDYPRAESALGEALTLWRQAGSARGTADCLSSLGNLASDRGDYEQATALFSESLRLWQDIQDPWGMASALNHLGDVARDRGRYAEAISYLEQSLALRRELGNARGVAETLSIMADVEHLRGDAHLATALHEESLRMRRELDDRLGMAGSLIAMGLLAFSTGAIAEVAQPVKEALEIFQSLGDRWGIAGALELLAGVATAQGNAARAARLFGAGAALRAAIDAPLPPAYQALYERTVAAVRDTLDAEHLEAAWAAGAALSLDEAIAEALRI